jgi:hypothetical protein
MRRALAILVATAVMAVVLTAGTASARVHGFTQAGCAHFPERSGADQAQGIGFPTDGAIPMAASGGRTQGKAGDGNRDCDVPPGPPKD